MTRLLWIGGALICLAGLLSHSFGTNNPNALRWFALSVFAAIPVGLWVKNRCPIPKNPIILGLLIFLTYAAGSTVWTHDWREGILSLNQLSLSALLFLTLVHVDRTTLLKVIPLAACAAIGIEIGISVFQPAIFGGLGNENFQAEFLVLTTPLAALGAWSWRHSLIGTVSVWFAAASLWQAMFFNTSDAKWAGLAGLGALTVLALFVHGRFIIASLLSLSGLGVLFAVLRGSKLTSVMERLELSSNTLSMWLDNPVFGVGVGSFNHQYPVYQEGHLRFLGTKVIRSVHNYAGASHNEYMQVFAVFGVAGVLLIGLIAFLIWRNRHRDAGANFGLAALSIFAGLALVGFPAQNPSTAILGITALALITRVSHAVDSHTHGSGLPVWWHRVQLARIRG